MYNYRTHPSSHQRARNLFLVGQYHPQCPGCNSQQGLVCVRDARAVPTGVARAYVCSSKRGGCGERFVAIIAN